MYMIRYNIISRPVHDLNNLPATLPATPPRPPCPKYGFRDPQLPRLTPLDSNEKEAFSRWNGLPWAGLRSMKMPQEKNGENTDLKGSTTIRLRTFRLRHFVYDTSSTDISSTDILSTDISSTTAYQRTGQLYIQLLFQQIVIFINSNFYLHCDSLYQSQLH